MEPQFNLFNAYASGGQPPFLFNATFDINQSNEASLYNSISSEFCYLYGNDIVFLPRETYNAEPIFGEYLASSFNKGYTLRAFIEEMEAWGGQGDIYSKFGLQVTDECTVYINKTTFSQAASGYPKQSDLIFVVKSNKLFEIQHIEDEVAPGFYHFGNKTWYKINCKLFSYNHESISQETNVGIPESIQALDGLLTDITLTEEHKETTNLSLDSKENITNIIPIQDAADDFIDDSEVDPLMS